MTRDDILRMVDEACGGKPPDGWGVMFDHDQLERFVALVIQYKALDQLTAAGQYEEGFDAGAAAEREACAKVCEALDDGRYAGGDQPYGIHYARAIRARGKE